MVAFYVEAAPGTHAALEGLDVARGCAVASFPARALGRAGGTDGARGAA